MTHLKAELEEIRAKLTNAIGYLDSSLNDEAADRQIIAERALYRDLPPVLSALDALIASPLVNGPDLQTEISQHAGTYVIQYTDGNFERVVDLVTDDLRPFVRAAVKQSFIINYIESQRAIADRVKADRETRDNEPAS
jgi:hypothetical protein